MSEKNEEKDNKEWKKSDRFAALDKVLPIVGSMISLLEAEKKRTIDKLEETKKVLEKINKENKK